MRGNHRQSDATQTVNQTLPKPTIRRSPNRQLDVTFTGRWAMTVNRRWRVTLRFEGGDAHEVAIEDYHRG